jgi:hypothetical protein
VFRNEIGRTWCCRQINRTDGAETHRSEARACWSVSLCHMFERQRENGNFSLRTSIYSNYLAFRAEGGTQNEGL